MRERGRHNYFNLAVSLTVTDLEENHGCVVSQRGRDATVRAVGCAGEIEGAV